MHLAVASDLDTGITPHTNLGHLPEHAVFVLRARPGPGRQSRHVHVVATIGVASETQSALNMNDTVSPDTKQDGVRVRL